MKSVVDTVDELELLEEVEEVLEVLDVERRDEIVVMGHASPVLADADGAAR